MSHCIHHWRQDAGDEQAPFTCTNCGEVKELETDFYKLVEARKGRPWPRTQDRNATSSVDLKSDELSGSVA